MGHDVIHFGTHYFLTVVLLLSFKIYLLKSLILISTNLLDFYAYAVYIFFRLLAFKGGLQRAFRESRSQSLNLTQIRQFINTNNPSPFTNGEMSAAIEHMTNDNQVMLNNDMVYLI